MASASQDLDLFVRDALLRGLERPQIEQALVAGGWPAEQARSAIGAYAEHPFPVPVPRPRSYLSARDAFLYLTLFVALYIAAYHLGSMLFDLLNRALPDPTDNEFQTARLLASIRYSAASIIIAFPVFLFLSRLVGKEHGRNPGRRLSLVRRWLTYLTMFVAACVLIGDMIALVNALLGGEMTLRFLLKVLVAATIAGGILGYYLWDLRQEEGES